MTSPRPKTTICARRKAFLGLVLLYALGRGLLLAWLVPPWQGPDEPSHFEYVILSLRARGLPEATDPALQAQILASMHQHDWHAWLGLATPETPPDRFETEPRLADAPTQVGNETPLGYLPFAPATFLLLPRGLEPTLRALRWTNVALTLLLLAAAWLAARSAFGPATAAATSLLVAAMPMLGFAGSVLSSDLPAAILATLWLGLAFEMQGLGAGDRRETGGGMRPRLAGPWRGRATWPALLALALLAGLAKRSGLFLLPLSLLLGLQQGSGTGPSASASHRGRRSTGRDGRRRLLPLLLLVGLLGLLAWPRPEQAAGWQRVGRPWGAERLPEAARSGAHGLRIVDDQPDSWQYLEQWIAVQPGAFVTVEAWFRAAPDPPEESGNGPAARPVGGADEPAPHAQLVVNSARGDWWGETVALGEAWTELKLGLRVPPNVRRLRIALVPGAGTAAGMARLEADDIRIRQPLPGRARVANGGAEQPRRLGTLLWAGTLRYTAAERLLRAVRAGLADPAGSLATLRRGLSFTFDSFWGGFGWLTVWPGAGYYRAAGLLSLLAAAAWLMALLRPGWLLRDTDPEARASALRLCALATGLALGLAIAGSMAGTAGSRLPQGRYLLPALLPMILPAVALARRLAPGRGPILLALGALLVDLHALAFTLWPTYRAGP